MSEVLIPFVSCLIVLDGEGDRLLAKYYDGKTKAQQKAYEAMIHKKTKAIAAKSETEVLLVDNEIIVFKAGSEVKFFLSGPVEEVIDEFIDESLIYQNELILVGVLEAVFDTVSTLLKQQVDQKTMLDNLELILLTLDEAIDHGYIMEMDSSAIVSRVLMKQAEQPTQPQTIGDLSLSQALGLARDQFFKTLTAGRGSDNY